MASKRKGSSRKAFRTPEVKNMRSALEKAKQERDAAIAVRDMAKAERQAAEEQADLLRKQIEDLQADNTALTSSLELIEEQFRAAQLKIMSLSSARPATDTEVATPEQIAYRGFYELGEREQRQCIKIGRMLGRMTSTLSADEASELFGLINGFMGYYRQVNDLDPDNREQFGKRDLVLAGYQIVRLEKKAQEEAERVFSSETALTELKSRMEGKIATLPAEKNPEVTTVAGKSELVLSEWAFLPDIDAWSDDEVLGELSEETVLVQQLKAKIHEVFDPMVAESLRAQFYADMQRMFQLCDKLNLMVSDELPFPLEMLPFDLANQIYWLNCDAKRRQMEKALAVEALVKFPA